jgi:transcriptional regulator with GAF, ATPase, and Fis domain
VIRRAAAARLAFWYRCVHVVTMPETIMGTQAGDASRYIEVSRYGLTVMSGPQKGTECALGETLFKIGKATENDLSLNDDTVSRVHCEISRDGRGYLLRDLKSTNGTLLDSTRIEAAYIKPGSVITIGKIELKVRHFAERVEVLPSERGVFGEAVGQSLVMRQIFGLLERLGPTDATVLIGGETGTGKDVLARAIHQGSPRKNKPFLVVDCGAVVGTLIESELFGHEKGSFTGASAMRQGAFELAHGGTLFLDEIGELPLDLQPKLLRALEQRSFRRVGGTKEIRVDIRVIAASKRNLKMEVERGKFREDLFFRLSVVPITVPPLRERRDDIPILAERLLASIAQADDAKLTPHKISRGAMESLRAHDWPGNVRELRNVLERAAYLARAAGDSELRMTGLPGTVPSSGEHLASTSWGPVPDAAGHEVKLEFTEARSYRDTRTVWETAFEVAYVRWLLDKHGGNISAAARAADMDRKYLHKLARKHGIHPAQGEDDES